MEFLVGTTSDGNKICDAGAGEFASFLHTCYIFSSESHVTCSGLLGLNIAGPGDMFGQGA